MSGFVVIDASVAVKWLVDEIYTPEAFALARAWANSDVQPAAPYLMPVEVANALYRRVLRRDLSSDAAILLLEGLLDSGIQFLEPAGLHRRAIELAGRLKQSAVYDAHYLALAEALDSEMWTADERFYRAAATPFRVRWLGDFT